MTPEQREKWRLWVLLFKAPHWTDSNTNEVLALLERVHDAARLEERATIVDFMRRAAPLRSFLEKDAIDRLATLIEELSIATKKEAEK